MGSIIPHAAHAVVRNDMTMAIGFADWIPPLAIGIVMSLIALWLWTKLRNAFRRKSGTPIELRLAKAIECSSVLPKPKEQHRVFIDGRLLTIPDYAYPEHRIAIFCDGWAYHGNLESISGDSWKRNRLSADGWIVLVFWGRDIMRDPNRCLRMIEMAYRHRNG
jgi:very-short-patch-repair endonuclease